MFGCVREKECESMRAREGDAAAASGSIVTERMIIVQYIPSSTLSNSKGRPETYYRSEGTPPLGHYAVYFVHESGEEPVILNYSTQSHRPGWTYRSIPKSL